jgi:cytochrome c oxidase subunit 2
MERRGGRWDGALFLLFVGAGLGWVAYAAYRYRWWLPPLASEHGAQVDALFRLTLWITVTVFVLVHLGLGLFAWLYRYREGRRAVHFPEQRTLEVIWTLAPTVILILLISMGARVWSQVMLSEPPPDAFVVEVVGQQFKWAFRYPGRDGRFGRVDPDLIDEQNNPLGIDLEDPASQDDIFFPAGQGELHLPVNRPCLVLIRSKDVLHSFYLPNFRVKMDAVPGMTTRFWFVPTRTGTFELACAELCGLGHYQMRGTVVVEDEATLRRWLDQQPTASEVIW